MDFDYVSNIGSIRLNCGRPAWVDGEKLEIAKGVLRNDLIRESLEQAWEQLLIPSVLGKLSYCVLG